ncbi:MAG: hypothetical protein HRU70_03785 [Phycisphaeraceae bacterium]|nr:MAG: hypothetical protein HRU70_03785 [Phycisphaeraceae bacterium]
MLATIVACLAACTPSGPPTVAFNAGQYPEAFNAARTALTDLRFEIDRVDARAGVITTVPKATSGLATPWDLEQSTITQEWEELVNQQRRIVRVTFQPYGPGPAGAPMPAETIPDMLAHRGPFTARFEVTLERVHRPGWRPASGSISLSTFATDPQRTPPGRPAASAVAIGDDPRLAQRLADRVRRSLFPGHGATPTPPRDVPADTPQPASDEG